MSPDDCFQDAKIFWLLFTYPHSGPVRDAALFWFGSIFHSLIVFLPGNVLGPHEVKLSYLLNVPYILVPLYVLHRVLVENRQKMYLKAKKVRRAFSSF